MIIIIIVVIVNMCNDRAVRDELNKQSGQIS
jgi:hypothetical protein